MLTVMFVAITVLVLIGSLPAWPYSREWGYAPGGTVGTILIVFLITTLMGQL